MKNRQIKKRVSSIDVARLAFPGGAMDMIGAWITTIDQAMERALPPPALAQMKIRERIRSLVQLRLDAVTGREEALRRSLAIMAMPQNARAALRTGWHSADVMWRLAGDTATDYNHYTKRAILASLYAATLAVFVDDESEGKAEEYRGRIDETHEDPKNVKSSDLINALEAILAGKPVPAAETKAFDCSVKRV